MIFDLEALTKITRVQEPIMIFASCDIPKGVRLQDEETGNIGVNTEDLRTMSDLDNDAEPASISNFMGVPILSLENVLRDYLHPQHESAVRIGIAMRKKE